jgi:endonuclease/exonuclease/phosphatase (EEP) superfamily protein YafD
MRNGKVDRAIWRATAAALVLTAASWLGGTLWLMELLSHFRLQFVAGSLLLLIGAIVRRRPAVAAVAAFVVAANSLPLLPYAMPGAAEAHAGESSLRILVANVQYRNEDYEGALALIEAENPDIVGLLEVNHAWSDSLSVLRERYPYHVAWPEEGAHGLALFSRVPIEELGTSPYREGDQLTAIRVRAELPEKPVILTLAHLISPTTPKRAALRNLQIRTIAGMVDRDHDDEHILIGDLNITPWSAFYAPLEQAGLVNAARGRGYVATWPAVLGSLGIPIDHVLLSDGLHVQQFRRGASFGSDHLPVVADVAISAAALRSSN